MNRYKDLIKTAQFAKFCNVSKQTLIYYDKIGIFHPSYVDEKGYRYYSLSQCESFSVISMLRELDTPLQEIREYLKNKSTQSFLELLNKKEKEVNKKIKELKDISRLIKKRKDITRQGMNVQNTEDITIDNIQEEKIIISDYIRIDEEEEYIKVINNLEKLTNKNNNKVLYIGGMIEKNKLFQNKDYNITHFYARISGSSKNAVIKPRGLYITTFHKGDYDTIYLSYNRLLDYIKTNNYVIIGNSYEEALVDSYVQDNKEEYLTRISIQVESLNFKK